MTNVISILQSVGNRDLVLLDEVGAGTDPQEGSALARALIDEFLKTGALVIATTHYTEVKAYASTTAGVENASVEFDLKTLSPTYRLSIGMPGQSTRWQLPDGSDFPSRSWIRRACLLDPDAVRTEHYLSEIRARRSDAERTLGRARDVEREAKQLRRVAREGCEPPRSSAGPPGKMRWPRLKPSYPRSGTSPVVSSAIAHWRPLSGKKSRPGAVRSSRPSRRCASSSASMSRRFACRSRAKSSPATGFR